MKKYVDNYSEFNKLNENVLNEGLSNSDLDQYIIYCRDPENQLKDLIEYFKDFSTFLKSKSLSFNIL